MEEEQLEWRRRVEHRERRRKGGHGPPRFSKVELGVMQQKTFLSLCSDNNNNFIKPKKVIINFDKII